MHSSKTNYLLSPKITCLNQIFCPTLVLLAMVELVALISTLYNSHCNNNSKTYSNNFNPSYFNNLEEHRLQQCFYMLKFNKLSLKLQINLRYFKAKEMPNNNSKNFLQVFVKYFLIHQSLYQDPHH